MFGLFFLFEMYLNDDQGLTVTLDFYYMTWRQLCLCVCVYLPVEELSESGNRCGYHC